MSKRSYLYFKLSSLEEELLRKGDKEMLNTVTKAINLGYEITLIGSSKSLTHRSLEDIYGSNLN